MASFSIEFSFRIVGALIAAVGGGFLGYYLADVFHDDPLVYIVIFSLLGILVGLIITPIITVRPLQAVRRSLTAMSPGRLAAIVVGLFFGLIMAALLALPLALLPSPFGQITPIVMAIVLSYLSVAVMVARQGDLQTLFQNFRPRIAQSGSSSSSSKSEEESYILLDTSVIIDGRIADISKTGFIQGILLVPNFVLLELQHIADSADALRRNRGRRGLEILSLMQNESPIPVRITDMDATEVRDVDSKLVSLARHLHCPIMTNDYNLNRVAELQGVLVLNINDLANAVKAAYLPGEELNIKIIQEGKEYGQGVGYLDDGTMVVVEDGEKLINKTLGVTVTKVLQTSAGRMIFAKPD